MLITLNGNAKESKVQIRENKKSGKFEAIVGGKVIFAGKNKVYVTRKAQKLTGAKPRRRQAAAKVEKAASRIEFTVNEKFQFIGQFVKMIVDKAIPSLIITGPGGLGKTFTVTQALEDNGMKEIEVDSLEGDYILLKGYSTAKALYRSLYDNNGKIIVFDDADSVHRDPVGANILKGALDSNGKRVIAWGAEMKGDDDLPQRFEFKGQVIFISNLSFEKFPQALISRSLKVDLEMTISEKLERIEYVLNQEKDKAGVKEVMAFVRKYADNINDLNVRSALNILKIRRSIGNGWEKLALYNACM